MLTTIASCIALASIVSAGAIVDVNNLPDKSESGQEGTNRCGTNNSQSANCQTAYMNSLNDFCLWAPPTPGQTIGDSERIEVAWCTAEGHGTRTVPKGAIHSAHWLETPHYWQVTGTGDFTSMNIVRGDEGGELDPHGADGNGNPIGGVVIHNGQQVKEWMSFMSDSEYCFRICKDGDGDAWLWCQHIYDIQGCQWAIAGQYGSGFDTCQGDGTDLPLGIYSVNGGLSTYQQSDGPAPTAHAPGASSNCQAQATIVGGQAAAEAPTTAASPSAASSSVIASSIASSSALSSGISTSTVTSDSMMSSSMAMVNSSTVDSSSSFSTSTLASSTSLLVTTVLSTAQPSSSSSSPSSSASASNSVAQNVAATPSAVSAARRCALAEAGSLVGAAVLLGALLM